MWQTFFPRYSLYYPKIYCLYCPSSRSRSPYIRSLTLAARIGQYPLSHLASVPPLHPLVDPRGSNRASGNLSATLAPRFGVVMETALRYTENEINQNVLGFEAPGERASLIFHGYSHTKTGRSRHRQRRFVPGVLLLAQPRYWLIERGIILGSPTTKGMGILFCHHL